MLAQYRANVAVSDVDLESVERTAGEIREYGVRSLAARCDVSDSGDVSEMMETTPMGRAGTIGDVSRTAVYLASDLSSYVIGQTIPVNGGMWIQEKGILNDEIHFDRSAGLGPHPGDGDPGAREGRGPAAGSLWRNLRK